MTNRKIGCLQLFSLTFFLSHSLFLFFSQSLLKTSGSDTLFACLLGTILNLLLFKIILIGRKKQKKEPFHDHKKSHYFLLLPIIIITVFLLRESALFIKSQYLTEGYLLEIMLLLSLTCYIISKKHLQQVASLSLLLFFFVVPLFGTNLIGMIPHFNITYQKPFLITGIFPILKGAVLFSMLSLLPLLLLLMIPYNQVDQMKKQDRYLYLALLVSNIVTMTTFVMIGFGPSFLLAQNYSYPYMLLLNKTAGFLVLDRFSYLLSFYVLFDHTILLGFLFTVIKKGIHFKKLIPDKNNR